MNNHVIDVALGNAAADMLVKNGRVINVFTREIYPADILIADKVIAAVGDIPESSVNEKTVIIDAKGQYLSPGFIDAHIHFESSMLTYTEFSKMTVKHGTTAVASDLMEVTIVSGKTGIDAIFEEASKAPVKLLYPVPSFMGEEDEIQTIGAALYPDMIEELLQRPEAVGLAEVLYPPILAKSTASAHVLELAERLGKTAEGHAPALSGKNLNAYCSAGIRSDHESTTKEEALDKLRRGLRILIREGCAAADLEEVIKMITEAHIDSRYCSLVSDDIDMLHIHEKGHLDYKVRMAVNAGVDPVEAIQMVTINPAESLKADKNYGSISPGKCADIVFLADLASCDVTNVIVNGELTVKDKELIKEYKAPSYKSELLNTVKINRTLQPCDLTLLVSSPAQSARVRVIGANSTTLLTDGLEAVLPIENGIIKADSKNDILHIACIERYGKNNSIGKAFIKGFGITCGAIATSVGHDHHNITVIGTNPEDMALAVNRLAELGGGIIIADQGSIPYELPLPICGLLSNEPGEACAKRLDTMQKYLREHGGLMQSPYMTLAFITLIYIPRYGITDRGLFDVLKGELVNPVISVTK